MDKIHLDTIESLIDQYGLAAVLRGISNICDEKSLHVQSNWQDRHTAQAWSRAGLTISALAVRDAIVLVSPKEPS